jgi:hypothetical protein
MFERPRAWLVGRRLSALPGHSFSGCPIANFASPRIPQVPVIKPSRNPVQNARHRDLVIQWRPQCRSGAKTSANFPSVVVQSTRTFSRRSTLAGVSGAGIAAFEPAPGITPPYVFFTAPCGTVDAGDAGVRVAGDLFIAALAVANAENFSVGVRSASPAQLQSMLQRRPAQVRPPRPPPSPCETLSARRPAKGNARLSSRSCLDRTRKMTRNAKEKP